MSLPKKGEKLTLGEVKRLCELFGLNDLWARIEANPPPKPFVTDGCSMWPDRWFKGSIFAFCVEHDLKYWVGGTDYDRLEADATLMLQVAKAEDVNVATAMFGGVRVGGSPKTPLPWKWGFGWED